MEGIQINLPFQCINGLWNWTPRGELERHPHLFLPPRILSPWDAMLGCALEPNHWRKQSSRTETNKTQEYLLPSTWSELKRHIGMRSPGVAWTDAETQRYTWKDLPTGQSECLCSSLSIHSIQNELESGMLKHIQFIGIMAADEEGRVVRGDNVFECLCLCICLEWVFFLHKILHSSM